jgi:hypothetical protein
MFAKGRPMDRRMLARLLVLAGLLVTVPCRHVHAERVVLRDGQSLIGVTADLGDYLRITTKDGIRTVAKVDVLRVERVTTKAAELAIRLETVDRTDPAALYTLATWARQQKNDAEADRLLSDCIELDPDHVDARRALGYLRIEGDWYSTVDALAIARGWLTAGLDTPADDLLHEVLAVVVESLHRRQAAEMLASVMMRAGAWDEVRSLWRASLTAARDPKRKARLEAYLSILNENPDGMWLLLGNDVPEGERDTDTHRSGFFALDETWVMDLALRREARKWVAVGESALANASPSVDDSRNERDRIAGALREADTAFARADVLSDGIAKGHRIELARRRIGRERRLAEGFAAEFDRDMAKLESTNTRSAGYRAILSRLFGHLNRVDKQLETVLTIASAFPDAFELEIQWTQLDLERIRGYRRALNVKRDANQ